MQVRFTVLPQVQDKRGDCFVSLVFGDGPMTVNLLVSADEAEGMARELAAVAKKARARIVAPGG